MEIIADGGELDRYIQRLSATLAGHSELIVSDKRPLLIDRYLSDAIEVDVDCLSDGRDTFVAGIMEHIEEAGIHSGDSACSLPVHSLDSSILVRIEKQTRDLALALKVCGLMNVQYAVKDRQIYILEVNPRASRTVPFVAKVIGLPVAGIASRVMAGASLKSFGLKPPRLKHVAVKEAVFPFARFPGVDPVLGPEMRSTGEVMGIDRDFAIAFAKSQLGSGTAAADERNRVRFGARGGQGPHPRRHPRLVDLGFRIIATRGTKRHLEAHGIPCEQVNKVLEGRPAYRGCDEESGSPARGEHDGRGQGAGGLEGHSQNCLAEQDSLLYNSVWRDCRYRGYQVAEGRQSRGGSTAELRRPSLISRRPHSELLWAKVWSNPES